MIWKKVKTEKMKYSKCSRLKNVYNSKFSRLSLNSPFWKAQADPRNYVWLTQSCTRFHRAVEVCRG